MSETGEAHARWRPYGDGSPGGERGFTLLELLVALAIMALITGIGFPALQTRLREAARAQARAELSLAAAQARADALAGAATVRLAPSRDGARLIASSGRPAVALPEGVTVAAPEGGLIFFPDGTARAAAGRVTAGATSDRFQVEAMTGRITFQP